MNFTTCGIEFEDGDMAKKCWLELDAWQLANDGIFFGCSRIFIPTIKKWFVTLIWETEDGKAFLNVQKFIYEKRWVTQKLPKGVESVIIERRIENMMKMEMGDFTKEAGGMRRREEGLNKWYLGDKRE